MNPETAPISIATRLHPDADRRLNAIGAAVTVLMHVLLLTLMLSVSLESSRRARSSPQSQAIQVSFITEQQQTAEITPPQPIEPPKEESVLTLLPTTVPTPKPATKSAPHKSAVKSAAAASTATPSLKPNNESEELEDVIGRIRDNWLEPPGVVPNFRCRLRIDYAVGGKIMALRFLKGCGTLALDDSVKRAIWKTQILPLQSAKREAGSLEIDFTP